MAKGSKPMARTGEEETGIRRSLRMTLKTDPKIQLSSKRKTQVYEKYKNQGLEILAFRCNQFGAQVPGNNEQILEFVCTRYKAEYPIFDKVDVNGDNAAPVYKFLKASKGGLFGDVSSGIKTAMLLTVTPPQLRLLASRRI